MPTKPKTKQAARSAEPKNTLVLFPHPAAAEVAPPPDNSAELSQRAARLSAYQAEARELNNVARFPKLDGLDGACVLALADLLAYTDHCTECLDDATNWLGGFLSDVLLEVVVHGPEWANAHPEYVKERFDRSIQYLRENLEICRNIEAKIPASVLEKLESWPTEAASA